jgi:transposase
VAVEGCCGSADLAQELADHAGWDVALGHPAYVAKLKGSPDKTDFSDARLLADLVRVSYLPAVWLPPREVRQLRQLVNYRARLVNQRRAAKLQVGAVVREQRVVFPKGPAKSRRSKAWPAPPTGSNLQRRPRLLRIPQSGAPHPCPLPRVHGRGSN